MLAPDTVLQGRYRIVRQLGQGGMGAVYEAVDLRLDTVVALKETLFTDERLRKQFEREARLLARLHHQALPRVSDHFTEGDGQFLVMQYIPGQDLFEMQARRGAAFPQPEVLRWADQLCDALDYLHTQDPQIIHRDIKPQNLKLTQRGQVVLLDFGLAKGSAGQMSVVTSSASIFGFTPNYAPLEQVQGLGTDSRSDIYSLAATLYHLLTNVKPPDALSRAAAIVNAMPDPLAPAETVSAQVSRSVARVLDKAMSQKRDDRYESAAQLHEALRSAADDPASEAATVTSTGMSTAVDTATPAAGTQIAGAQTKGFASEAQTLLADDSTRVRKQSLAGETATLVKTSPRQNLRAWIAAVAVVVVIAGAAGAFYAYRASKSQAAANASPTPENTGTPSQTTPVPTPEQALGTETKSATPKTETATERSRHPESRTPRATPHPTNETVVTDRPRIPPEPPPEDPFQHQQPRPTPGDNRIITFPNGTRMERRADGTTIVTFPDGRTRVFPPGTMPPNRRRPRP